MSTGPVGEQPETRRRGPRRKIGGPGPWDSVCGNCGRFVKGVRMTRGRPWQRVLPYCANCNRYALRGVHAAALAIVLAPLAAAALLLALYLLLWLTAPAHRFYGGEDEGKYRGAARPGGAQEREGAPAIWAARPHPMWSLSHHSNRFGHCPHPSNRWAEGFTDCPVAADLK